MIAIILSKELYENDIRPLVRAFYPGEETRLLISEDIEADMKLKVTFNEGRNVLLDWSGEKELSETVQWLDDRIDLKNELKRAIYRMLSFSSGRKLPWGSLTGIRPTKIALTKMLEWGNEGALTPDEIAGKRAELADHMMRDYLLSEEKTALAINVAGIESEMLLPIDRNTTFSLYVGIPFCPTICAYCSFASSPISDFDDRVEKYLQALHHEIRETAAIMGDKKPVSVYFGGGTPTSVTDVQLKELIDVVLSSFDTSALREFTIEAGRPDSLTDKKLEVIENCFREIKPAMGRMSVNPQTMNQKTLDLIGRAHTVDQIKSAYIAAREHGISTINMDLILALPEETIEDVAHTMEEIRNLAPDNLTVHSLALKTKSRFSQEWEKWQEYTYNNSDAIMEIATKAAADLGMHPYYLYRQKNIAGNLENVGFSIPGKEGLYNSLIMEQWHDIAACGAGGASRMVYYDNEKGWQSDRAENVKNVDEYISRIDEMIERKRKLYCGA